MSISRFTTNSPVFFEPQENTPMVKYIDLAKFISILKNKSLFFCRIDKLEDKFEGTLPLDTHKHIVAESKYLRDVRKFFTRHISDEELENSATDQLNWQSKLRSITCVNCWNEFKGESYALWKIYAGMDQGIMIKTDFSKLIQAFRNCNQKIFCSRVKYIDYQKDYMDFGNTMIPFVHKHRAYTYENEIRLIHEVTHNQWKYDWDSEEYNSGIMIPIDINFLIDNIYINPFAPQWFKPLIEDLIKKYFLNCQVSDSILR
jgi:hypothetical protein